MLRGSRVSSGEIYRPFIALIVPPLAARDLSKTTSGESWKHLNYRITIQSFSAQGTCQRGTGGESWNVEYGDSTISHKFEVLPKA
jgi:hypothetical protein